MPPPPEDEVRSRLPRTLMRLEDRIVLDAAGADGAHVAHAADGGPHDAGGAVHDGGLAASAADALADLVHAAGTGAAPLDAVAAHVADALAGLLRGCGAHADGVRVVAISDAVAEADALAGAVRDGHTPVVFDAQADLTTLLHHVQDALHGEHAASIALVTHGVGPGSFDLTHGLRVDLEALQNPEVQAFWRGLGALVGPDGRIDLLACDAAAGPAGHELVAALQSLAGTHVAASTDVTGHAAAGGDWLLECGGVDAGTLYFDGAQLAHVHNTLGPPSIADSGTTATTFGGGGAVVLDNHITITPGTSGLLSGVAIRIRGYHADQDRLAFDPAVAAANFITGTFDTTTGELLLKSVDGAPSPVSTWQNVLRTVTYENTSLIPDTSPRQILITIGDDFTDGVSYRYLPSNGHYYAVSTAPGTDYASALAAAGARSLHGLSGYLSTLTSAAEMTFVKSMIPGLGGVQLWLGGSDAATEGVWIWQAGPEAGQQFWPGGTSLWFGTEPDNAGDSDYLCLYRGPNPMYVTGLVDATAASAYLHLVEFGGLDSDTEGGLVASIDVTVHDRNDAPVLDTSGDFHFDGIAEDTVAPAGTSVGHLLASAGGDHVTDLDPGAAEGIAVTGLDAAHGVWQYSLDNGVTWHGVNSVSDAHALLLRDADLLRFVPNADWHGSLADALHFRAWDQTAGAVGDYADVSTHGGDTAFSDATAVAHLDVTPVNDAPVTHDTFDDLTAHEDSSLHFTLPTDTFTDIDGDALALHATLAGGLPLPDWLHFDPTTGTFSGTPTNGDVGVWHIQMTANDGHGGVASLTFGLYVANTNDAPVVDTPLDDGQTHAGDNFDYTVPDHTFHDDDVGDVLAYSAHLANGAPLPTWLTFDPLTRTLHGTAGATDTGDLVVHVTATDLAGAAATTTLTLHVLPAITPPAPGDDQTPTVPTTPTEPTYNHSSDGSSGTSTDAGTDSSASDSSTSDGDHTTTTDPTASDWDHALTPTDTTPTTDLSTSSFGNTTNDADHSAAPADAGNHDAAGHDAAFTGADATGPAANAQPAHRLEEELIALPHDDALLEQVTTALFSGELLKDMTQPTEFRDAWDTILTAYAESGVEVATYLESAFRAVTESALIYRQADQVDQAVQQALAAAHAQGWDVDLAALQAQLAAARAQVKDASAGLEDAIQAAAAAGRTDSFDQALRDVISAALHRLMQGNEALFVETQALAAATATLRDAHTDDGGAPTTAELDAAVVAARTAAHERIVEMRASWDRVAQDVFTAFVTELVHEQGRTDAAPPTLSTPPQP